MDVILNEDTKKLLEFKGYFERFFLLKFEHEHTTDQGIYHMLEKEYYDTFGLNKYSSFESFKTSKYRYLRKLVAARK